MPCYKPLTAFKAGTLPSGKARLLFTPQMGAEPLLLPCGRCIGCRLERSRQWALRCVHEADMHPQNCFITLTYDNEHLPEDGSLHKDHFQKFMKRLRKHISPSKVRFFMCGEYGDENFRPHYHACLFGYDFPDKELWQTREEISLYRSITLERLWPFGFSTIGDVTFESAAYTARYVMKKVTGEKAEDHYSRLNAETGEIYQLQPEYTTMSLKPGIGKGWYDKYKSDLEKDFITSRGIKMHPPKYYDRILEIEDPEQLERKKEKRKKLANEKFDDIMKGDRLEVMEKIKERRLKLLPRKI